jgi:hypothetical protein
VQTEELLQVRLPTARGCAVTRAVQKDAQRGESDDVTRLNEEIARLKARTARPCC